MLHISEGGNGLKIHEIKTAIKVPKIQLGEESVPMGNPFLDIVTKFSTQDAGDICHTTSLQVEHLIMFDGISLRRLELGDIRTPATLKGGGKISIKNNKTEIPELASHFTDLGIQAASFGIAGPVINLGKWLFRNTDLSGNMSHTKPFGADLVIKNHPVVNNYSIGNMANIVHKWNSYKPQVDDERFETETSDMIGKPVIRSTSEIHIGQTGGKVVASRVNIPIFGLSRDHARDIQITTETIVSQIGAVKMDASTVIETPRRGEERSISGLVRNWSQIDLGNMSYETLIRPEHGE